MARFRVGFTTRASCLTAAGATALVCGMALGELDLVRAGVLAIAIPVMSALVVHRTQVRIANRRGVEPARASAGDPVEVHLTITNRSVLPTGSLMLEDRLPEQLTGRARFVLDGLAGREARTVSYRMPSLPRGRYRAGPLQIRLTDPFHMIDMTRSFTATSQFVVGPIVDVLPSAEPPRSYDVGDNAGSHSVGVHGADDASTREYRTGDDLRKIHWRSSARTGTLMVRQEERPWQGQATLLLDTRSGAHAGRTPTPAPPDVRQTSSLEWAVSAAASIGTHLLLAGREVGMISELSDDDRFRPGTPDRLVDHLAALRASARPDLAPVAGLLRAAAHDSALIAILGRLDATSLRIVADAHPRGSSVPAFGLVLDVDSWADREADPAGSAECRAAARAMGAAGWRVVVVRSGDSTARCWQTLLRGGSAQLDGLAMAGGPR